VRATDRPCSPLQLSSETDFVARNAAFQALASRLAGAALSSVAVVPVTFSSGLRAAEAEAAAAALGASQLVGGDSTGADCTASGAVVELVGKVRENIVLRRAGRLGGVEGGLVVAYTHAAVSQGMGSHGVLLALAPTTAGAILPTDNALLQSLGRRIAMHVAAARPLYAVRADVPAPALAREQAVHAELAKSSGKTGAILDKVVAGRLSKFYSEVCLEEQPFILGEGEGKVSKVVADGSRAAGHPARVAAFMHFVVGEASEPTPG